MTPREVVRATIEFRRPERLARSFPEPYGNDFTSCAMSPHPDARPGRGVDEWGAVWENIGVCRLGEVKDFPIKTWADLERIPIPDVTEERRWQGLAGIRERDGERYLIGTGISLYERVHFLRGLENTWMDLYTDPDCLRRLLGILVDMNLHAIERYARLGCDGFMFCDDWGLQDRLMISPASWREFWLPAYTRVYGAARAAGLHTLLHSCGYILDIIPDLIGAGLDVIQLDQQENMGLKNLAAFTGKITFWCPVDIQTVMCRGTTEQIRAWCHRLVRELGTPSGGFLPKWYSDPVGAGHSPAAIEAMCTEFLGIKPGPQ